MEQYWDWGCQWCESPRSRFSVVAASCWPRGHGGESDHRQRQSEFDEVGPIPAQQLLEKLKSVLAEVDLLLDRLEPQILVEKRKVQGFDESGLSIIVHVVEHFSYHVGQITYITKAKKNVDLKYYGGVDLDQTNQSK